jgi:hypothetical protein
VTDKSTADILEEAADILETVGWATHTETAFGAEGAIVGHCSTGAIKRAAGFYEGDWTEQQLEAKWESVLRATVVLSNAIQDSEMDEWSLRAISPVDPSARIQHWNDCWARSADVVIDKLKEAAKDLRNTATPEGVSK